MIGTKRPAPRMHGFIAHGHIQGLRNALEALGVDPNRAYGMVLRARLRPLVERMKARKAQRKRRRFLGE